MVNFVVLLLLSLVHVGRLQDFQPGPYRDGPGPNRGPPPPPENFGPVVRQYGGGGGFNRPPPGPPGGYGPGPDGPRPPYPFEPPFQPNRPPPPRPFDRPYGPPMGPPPGPPGPYGGGPPRRPEYGQYRPPMMGPPPPTWVRPGIHTGGPPGGPPAGYGPNQQQPWPPRPNHPPVDSAPPKPTKGPMDFMADVVNSLASRVLLDHVTARGNFVFSPYGATSVLCVLNEGSSGMSAVQLSTTLNLPKDIELVRVGMRDLHRHLKSYFHHNGFLQGVDLSHNNTSLRADFIPLLRFYGYHVDEDSKMAATTKAPAEEGTTMPPNDEMATEEEASPEPPPSDSMTQEEDEAQTEEQATEEGATEEAATEEAPEEEAESRRRKRANIELNNGISEKGNTPESLASDPLAPRKRFRLFSGDFTSPVVVQERTEMLLFASLPQLGGVAALIPLDEPRYGMLIMVPYDGRPMALKQLVKEMTNAPLRNVLDSLRPNHVHYTVPAFSAKGTVVLTSALQQIGIHDIFDPRLAKLDRMSVDEGLFVRHLEQVVDMEFGKVKSLHTRVITARSTSDVLDAMRPFVYVVIDRVTQVALLAGKVEDPTTDRIF